MDQPLLVLGRSPVLSHQPKAIQAEDQVGQSRRDRMRMWMASATVEKATRKAWHTIFSSTFMKTVVDTKLQADDDNLRRRGGMLGTCDVSSKCSSGIFLPVVQLL